MRIRTLSSLVSKYKIAKLHNKLMYSRISESIFIRDARPKINDNTTSWQLLPKWYLQMCVNWCVQDMYCWVNGRIVIRRIFERRIKG